MTVVSGLFSLHDRVFESIERAARGWLLPSAARLTFAAVLLVYYWNSAGTKLDGFGLSPSAFVQIFPQQAEAYGYDSSQFGLLPTLIVWAGALAEFVLPALIVLGLFTRLAALGMIGFIIVQSLTDIYGHMADSATIGAFFDGVENARILDLRAFWLFVLLYLVIKGGGLLSLDRLLGRR